MHTKKEIKEGFREILQNNEIGSEKLDKAVLPPLEVVEHAEEISLYAKALSKARREGKEVSEMISGIEEEEVGELEGAKIISEGIGQKKLTEF